MKNVHLRPTVFATWNVSKISASEKQKKQRLNLPLRSPEEVSISQLFSASTCFNAQYNKYADITLSQFLALSIHVSKIIHISLYIHSVVTSQRTLCISITKTNHSELYRDIITLHFESQKKIYKRNMWKNTRLLMINRWYNDYLSSFNPCLMHHFYYTKVHFLTNTPRISALFGAILRDFHLKCSKFWNTKWL